MKKTINILFIGDIVGRPGRRAAGLGIEKIKQEQPVDLVIANADNLASGNGIMFKQYEEMLDKGVDYFTSGNHVFDKAEFVDYLSDEKIKVIRPDNYVEEKPGRGSAKIQVGGETVVIANIQGKVFMPDEVENPFVAAKNIIDENPGNIVIVDFHAEATSEKVALGYYLDGFATAVLGTHTHIQTADERILPKGTAYITDAGMCGPINSVLGVEKEIIIEKFLTDLPKSHKVASGESIFNAVLLEINSGTKRATAIRRISLKFD